MPNNITSILIAYGDVTKLEEIKSLVSSNNASFDFSKIVPPPNDPAYRNLPSQDEARYSPNYWKTWNTKNWGTKWNAYDIDSNSYQLAIRSLGAIYGNNGTNDAQIKIIDLLLSNDNAFIDLGIELVKNLKLREPYDFINSDFLTFKFETAWKAPFPVIKRLSSMYPECRFKLIYADEDIGSNCGIMQYSNGSYIDLFHSDDLNEDYTKPVYQNFARIVNGID